MDDEQRSLDDILEEERDTPENKDIEPLPEDNQTPASPAANPDSKDLPNDYPTTDSNIDSHELYDEGAAGTTETQK